MGTSRKIHTVRAALVAILPAVLDSLLMRAAARTCVIFETITETPLEIRTITVFSTTTSGAVIPTITHTHTEHVFIPALTVYSPPSYEINDDSPPLSVYVTSVVSNTLITMNFSLPPVNAVPTMKNKIIKVTAKHTNFAFVHETSTETTTPTHVETVFITESVRDYTEYTATVPSTLSVTPTTVHLNTLKLPTATEISTTTLFNKEIHFCDLTITPVPVTCTKEVLVTITKTVTSGCEATPTCGETCTDYVEPGPPTVFIDPTMDVVHTDTGEDIVPGAHLPEWEAYLFHIMVKTSGIDSGTDILAIPRGRDMYSFKLYSDTEPHDGVRPAGDTLIVAETEGAKSAVAVYTQNELLIFSDAPGRPYNTILANKQGVDDESMISIGPGDIDPHVAEAIFGDEYANYFGRSSSNHTSDKLDTTEAPVAQLQAEVSIIYAFMRSNDIYLHLYDDRVAFNHPAAFEIEDTVTLAQDPISFANPGIVNYGGSLHVTESPADLENSSKAVLTLGEDGLLHYTDQLWKCDDNLESLNNYNKLNNINNDTSLNEPLSENDLAIGIDEALRPRSTDVASAIADILGLLILKRIALEVGTGIGIITNASGDATGAAKFGIPCPGVATSVVLSVEDGLLSPI